MENHLSQNRLQDTFRIPVSLGSLGYDEEDQLVAVIFNRALETTIFTI